MSYAIRARQARCAALGFWPGPLDGNIGPRTREAAAAALALQRAKGLSFQHPTGLTRIHWHWTGGGHAPSATDLRAYHCVISGDGSRRWPVEPTAARSHTLNANGGAIGIAVCAMAGARERPFERGRAPITPAQVSALARETARMCRAYDIPVPRAGPPCRMRRSSPSSASLRRQNGTLPGFPAWMRLPIRSRSGIACAIS